MTTWIVVAMAAGAEIGHDWPAAAVNLRVLSLIFLNLIKTIIAPLLFSTLVVGIAGHSNLRQMGRMGIKALIYFEIVTTLALLIGLAAINITGAGVGVSLQPTPAGCRNAPAAAPQSASDIILHAFPENIAKAVAEGQVLQIVVFSIIFGIALAMLSEVEAAPDPFVLRKPVRDDVQIHQYRHDVCACRRRRSNGIHGRAYGIWCPGEPVRLLGTMYAALLVFRRMRPAAHCGAREDSAS